MNPERGLYDSDEDLAAYLARITSPPPPVKGGYEHTFAPDMKARINAEVQPDYRDAKTSIGANLGPLSLNGGLQIQQAMSDEGNPYAKVTPNFGAGMTVPLGGGTAEARANLTPGQLLQLDAEYRRKLLGGDLSVTGNYSQPTEGAPGWGVGLRYNRKF